MYWSDIASVTANFQRIRSALGDYYNGRAPAVYGKRNGEWVRLTRVTSESGIPYGHTPEEKFVLREARVGEAK